MVHKKWDILFLFDDMLWSVKCDLLQTADVQEMLDAGEISLGDPWVLG